MCKGRKGGGDSAQGLSLFLERGEIEERRDGRVAGRTVPERKKRLIIYMILYRSTGRTVRRTVLPWYKYKSVNHLKPQDNI